MEKNKKETKKIPNNKRKIVINKEPKYQKYIYPSVIFGLMLSGFNYIFLIFSLYSSSYTGIYMQIVDSVFINVLINTIFDCLLFGSTFFVLSANVARIIYSSKLLQEKNGKNAEIDKKKMCPEKAGTSCIICGGDCLQSQFLADILGDGVLVDEEVHGVGSDEGLGHVPDAFVVATLTP